MEGAGEEMIHRRPCAGLLWCLLWGLAVTGAFRTGMAQEKGGLLLVERPARLTVLNRYQQNATSAERAAFQPFAPIVVVKERDLLGDGFTPCMRVKIGGVEFFLVRDGSGRLAGEAHAGAVFRFEGVPLAGDTISILSAGVVRFTSADSRNTRMLGAGERLVRIFSLGQRTYVRRSTGSTPYGWAELAHAAQGRSWAIARLASAVPSTVPPPITDAVRSAVSRTNNKLTSIFAFIATRGASHRVTPRWEVQSEGKLLRCTLVGGAAQRDLPESTRYLMNDIEGRIAGSGFRAVESPDGFEVRPD
jgi:hypothetical protein